MCLAQGPQRSDVGEARTSRPSVSSQALYHWATALPKSNIIIIVMNTDKKISFLFKIYKNSKTWSISGLPFGLKPINLKTFSAVE